MKNNIKKLAALVLALVMVLSLCACGDSSSSGDSAAKEETPEYVYHTDFQDLLTDCDHYLNPRVYTANGFYATSYEKVGEREPYDGEVAEYEGQFDVYSTVLYFVDFSGAVSKLTSYVPIDVNTLITDGTFGDEALDLTGVRSFYSGSDIYGITSTDDGKLIVVESAYLSYNNAPESVEKYSDEYYNYSQYKSAYFIRSIDQNGNILTSAKVDISDEQYINAYNMCVASDGNVVCGSDGGIVVIGMDGSIVSTITSEEDLYIDTMVKLKDGRICGAVYGSEGMELRVIDTANSTIGDTLPLPSECYNPMTGNGEYDLYYTSGSYFYGIKYSEDQQTCENVKLFNWINCDIDSNDISSFLVREDGSVVVVINEYDSDDENYDITLATISLVPYDSVPHKQEITLAAQYIQWDMRSKVVKFNRHNDQYRIVVKDYSEFNTEDDYSAGLTKLTTELLAGNVPDIIDLSGLPYEQLAAKGLLADLYELIDADSELSRDDFFPNVLKALEVDGGLYSTVTGFSLTTVIGAASVVGDEPGWTYDEFNAALATMREYNPECEPFDIYTTREDILRICLQLDMNNYVNWATGEVNFDNDSFIGLLNFAANFPETFDYDNYEYSPDDNTDNRIADGRQMLVSTSIYSVDSVMYNDTYFGGESVFVGYPTLDGSSGNLFSIDGGYAISAKSANKDAAWSFLREFFTEDYQSHKGNVYNIPANINAYNARVEDYMTPEYEKDADGNYRLDEDGNKIPIPRISYGTENGVIDFYALTQEQADKLYQAITSTTAVYDYYTDSIFDIVVEQSQAFFAGQKSAEDVAKLVQSKANIYVNEQR